MTDAVVIRAVCPNCDKHLDRSTGAGHGQAPKPGDLSICYYCAVLSVFTDELGLRRVTLEEWVDLPPRERTLVLNIQQQIQGPR